MQFEGDPDPGAFEGVAGVGSVTVNGDQLALELNGDIRPVLEAAVAAKVVDLTARHADLDELFLSYYRDTETGEAR